MSEIERLPADGPTKDANFTLRSHKIGDMGWVVHRESLLYAEQYGFDETFEALVAQIVADFLTGFDGKRERCWIAEEWPACWAYLSRKTS